MSIESKYLYNKYTEKQLTVHFGSYVAPILRQYNNPEELSEEDEECLMNFFYKLKGLDLYMKEQGIKFDDSI